jgi:hypothetical protein
LFSRRKEEGGGGRGRFKGFDINLQTNLNVYLHEHRQTRYHTRCQRGGKVG